MIDSSFELKDPVCGMTVTEETAVSIVEWEGVKYGFCAEYCHDLFMKHPEKFVETKTEEINENLPAVVRGMKLKRKKILCVELMLTRKMQWRNWRIMGKNTISAVLIAKQNFMLTLYPILVAINLERRPFPRERM